MTGMDELIAFVTARLDVAEGEANEVHLPRECSCVDRDGEFDPRPIWCDCKRPARELREVAAKRGRLGLMVKATTEMDRLLADDKAGKVEQAMAIGYARAATVAVKHDAAIWSDHGDYRPEWAPGDPG